MTQTEDEIRKSIDQANTEAAVAALRAQVDKSAAGYQNMNRDLRAAAAEGAGVITKNLQSAGINRNTGSTAGMILQSAVGDAMATNANAQKLGAQALGNQMNYLRQSSAERQEALAKNEAEWQKKISEQQTEQEKALAEQQIRLQKAEALQKAKTLAKYGDFTGYGEMGYTPEQTAGMRAVYAKENEVDDTFRGVGNYAQTLLSIYEGNKNYDIRGALKEALQNGLITQQDHDAALIQSSGIRHEEPAPEDYAGLEGFAETLLDIYETNENFDVIASLQEALQNGLITQQDYNAAVIAARGIVPGGKNKKNQKTATGTEQADDHTKWPEYAAAEAALNRATLLPNGKYLVTNSEDWAALKTFYERKGENIGKYFEFEEEKLTVPVYGDITYSEAEKLEQQGYLIMTGVATDGTPIYSVPPRKPGMVNAMW